MLVPIRLEVNTMNTGTNPPQGPRTAQPRPIHGDSVLAVGGTLWERGMGEEPEGANSNTGSASQRLNDLGQKTSSLGPQFTSL